MPWGLRIGPGGALFLVRVVVDEAGDHLHGRSSSAWSKYADGRRRISLGSLSSRFSLLERLQPGPLLGGEPSPLAGIYLGLFHPLVQRLGPHARWRAMRPMAAASFGSCAPASGTRRTARSFTSGGYRLEAFLVASRALTFSKVWSLQEPRMRSRWQTTCSTRRRGCVRRSAWEPMTACNCRVHSLPVPRTTPVSRSRSSMRLFVSRVRPRASPWSPRETLMADPPLGTAPGRRRRPSRGLTSSPLAAYKEQAAKGLRIKQRAGCPPAGYPPTGHLQPSLERTRTERNPTKRRATKWSTSGIT
jgi:hypothetical protein